MLRVLAVQHVRCETLGTIADALEAAGVAPRLVRTFEQEAVPNEMGEAAGLIIMGGPMGVYEQDRYPFLRQEIRLIEQALEEGKPVLGVCLGSQLLAAALGAAVVRGKTKEIGWYPITLTSAAIDDPLWKEVEPSFMAYHWHGDLFALPGGAVTLASSDLTLCQAFRYGRNAYGFLFHMEVTQSIIEHMVRAFRAELQTEGIDGRDIVGKVGEHLPHLQRIGGVVFHRWASLLQGGSLKGRSSD